MEIIILLFLIVLFIIFILGVTLYKGQKKETKNTVHSIELVLRNTSIPLLERIEDVKFTCRMTKGLVPYAIYCVLDTISHELKDEKYE